MFASSNRRRKSLDMRNSVRWLVTRTGILFSSLLLLTALSVYVVFAAISVSTSTNYTQDFDGIGSTPTATLPTDFKVDKPTTVRTVGTYAAALTSTSAAGGANLSTTASQGVYNFGSGTSSTGSDRAVGFLSSGSGTQSGNLYAQLSNTTGAALTGLQVNYDVEKYRNGSNPGGFRIQLFYSTDGLSWTNAGPDFLTTFSANADNLGFATAPGATVPVASSLLVPIPDGSTLYLAWNYSVASGSTTTNAQALAIDNISIGGLGAGSPTPTPTPSPTPSPSPTPTPIPAGSVVISQVYGGGGNSGADFKNDFIEILNHGISAIDLSGWSVQYTSAAGTTWQVTQLTNFTLQPGQYYLIQEARGTGGTTELPAVDAPGSIAMSANNGKVALVSNILALSGACPTGSGIVDFVGYGTANCFEGTAAAPGLVATTAAIRKQGGCTDTDINSSDFAAGAPTPRNSSSPTTDCNVLTAVGSANPRSVGPGDSSTLTVNVFPANNPPSSGVTVTADLSSIGGSPAQAFSGVGNTFTFVATIPEGTSPGLKSLPVIVSDTQGRSTGLNILLNIQQPHVVISQIYGGGGNTDATYTNDFVELYNPTTSSVDLTGWSVQYASATGAGWDGNKQPIGGSIGPGEYYLIGLGTNGAVGDPLPPQNISGQINMAAISGKVALVNSFQGLSGECPTLDPHVVDFVGYGTSLCFEGSAGAPPASNTTSDFRINGGATDTDDNGHDFTAGTPAPRRTAPIVELGPIVLSTDPSSNGFNTPHDATISVTFTEPVDVTGSWYMINCANSGVHNDATVAGSDGSRTYAITPNTNFQFGEQCTVTIVKDGIHDQDLDDSGPNTDTLSADYTWTFTVVGAGQPAPYPPDVHLTMGNPTNAVADLLTPDNYLMVKPTYALSYNRQKGTPNWVSWHLDTSWFGSLARVDTFRPDPAVPPDWYRVQATDYFTTGFDRGHMTPNADRDNQNRIPINQETYLMSNMVPQAPDNNQGPWANFENYLRGHLTTAGSDFEMYIVSGPLGVGGTGSGGFQTTIANGHVTVPAYTWKVVLVLPKGDNDISRVTAATRTIAAMMPNIQGIKTGNSDDWMTYLTTVDAVEQATGYDFFANLPDAIENAVEAGTNGDNPPGTENQTSTTAEETADPITINAVSPKDNPTFTTTIVSQPGHGSVSGTGLTLTYTPVTNFYGSDSFTFSVNDGNRDSNVSTVNITVTNVNDAPVALGESYVTNSNETLNVAAGGVLSNDSDVDGPTLSPALVSGPGHGSLTLSADGSFSYEPAHDFTGNDSFTYRAFDGIDYSNTATVTITVNDTVPPVLTTSVATPILTTTNSTLVNVGFTASATDNSGGTVTINVAVFGDEDDQTPTANNTVHSPDAKDIASETLRLRGERIEEGDGRVYLIVTTATDPSGNVSRSYQTVVVPKSNKQANIDLVSAQAAAAASYAQSHNGTPPPGYFVIGDGPIIGPKQ